MIRTLCDMPCIIMADYPRRVQILSTVSSEYGISSEPDNTYWEQDTMLAIHIRNMDGKSWPRARPFGYNYPVTLDWSDFNDYSYWPSIPTESISFYYDIEKRNCRVISELFSYDY
jgi:hypothetical protein